MTEQWKPVAGFDGYEVSDLGRVRSWKMYHHDPGPRFLTPSPTDSGHLRVGLTNGSEDPRTRMVHRLVLNAFVGSRPKGLVTRHMNGDKTDNRLANLQYGTYSENQLDSVKHGTHLSARRTECVNGHPFDESNTHTRVNGNRACRECARLATQRYRSRLAADEYSLGSTNL